MAHSYKRLDRGSWNKFQGARTEGPGYDKCMLRMGNMPRDLMRRKSDFVPSRDF